VLLVEAGLILVTIAMVHSDNRVANRIILAIFASGVGVAVLLIASHSQPFAGQVAVRPAALLQVMPEADPLPAGGDRVRVEPRDSSPR
jgi:multisubunit Na+/H+ antiporter MnhC subunit